jgi:uncharacterized protein (TIGR04551 family)
VAAVLVGASAWLAAAPARATGFTDIGEDIVPRTKTEVELDGYLRARAYDYYNFDLDRGLTPSGQPLFPVPQGDPNAQAITGADMRLRTDISVYAPGGMVAVKARIDMLDNVALGSNYQGIPSSSSSQVSPSNAFAVKRAYGEAVTPIGVLAAGRIGSTWGMGMLTNGGDCADCNSGDAADRIAFITPIGGFIWAAAYDFSAIGPTVPGKPPGTVVNVDPSVNVNTVTFAFLRWRDERARDRRRLAGKSTFEIGAYASHRWQNNDVPSLYLPLSIDVPTTATQVMSRGFTATAFDAWTRVTTPWMHLEAEGAVLIANVAQPSLIPGVLYNVPVKSLQVGAALESEFGAPEDAVTGGLDAGYASGNPTPGFGVNPPLTGAQAKPGDIDGGQLNLPYQNTIDNFRFHPDYIVDRILFREIIGTVTGAVYLRPHVRWNIVHLGTSWLTASLAGVASMAVYGVSTPGGKQPLGIELDPTLSYGSKDGFGAALEHGVLFPLSGLDNPELGLKAKPGQLIRLRLTYAF